MTTHNQYLSTAFPANGPARDMRPSGFVGNYIEFEGAEGPARKLATSLKWATVFALPEHSAGMTQSDVAEHIKKTTTERISTDDTLETIESAQRLLQLSEYEIKSLNWDKELSEAGLLQARLTQHAVSAPAILVVYFENGDSICVTGQLGRPFTIVSTRDEGVCLYTVMNALQDITRYVEIFGNGKFRSMVLVPKPPKGKGEEVPFDEEDDDPEPQAKKIKKEPIKKEEDDDEEERDPAPSPEKIKNKSVEKEGDNADGDDEDISLASMMGTKSSNGRRRTSRRKKK